MRVQGRDAVDTAASQLFRGSLHSWTRLHLGASVEGCVRACVRGVVHVPLLHTSCIQRLGKSKFSSQFSIGYPHWGKTLYMRRQRIYILPAAGGRRDLRSTVVWSTLVAKCIVRNTQKALHAVPRRGGYSPAEACMEHMYGVTSLKPSSHRRGVAS
jgi:hypothetical protein